MRVVTMATTAAGWSHVLERDEEEFGSSSWGSKAGVKSRTSCFFSPHPNAWSNVPPPKGVRREFPIKYFCRELIHCLFTLCRTSHSMIMSSVCAFSGLFHSPFPPAGHPDRRRARGRRCSLVRSRHTWRSRWAAPRAARGRRGVPPAPELLSSVPPCGAWRFPGCRCRRPLNPTRFRFVPRGAWAAGWAACAAWTEGTARASKFEEVETVGGHMIKPGADPRRPTGAQTTKRKLFLLQKTEVNL